MKRCLNCNALIREDDDKCPYCHDNPNMVVDEFLITGASEQWEKISESFRQLGIHAKELRARVNTVTIIPPNEMRKMLGLEEISKGE